MEQFLTIPEGFVAASPWSPTNLILFTAVDQEEYCKIFLTNPLDNKRPAYQSPGKVHRHEKPKFRNQLSVSQVKNLAEHEQYTIVVWLTWWKLGKPTNSLD